MIAAGGIENFSVRKLCQQADVAQGTVYNAFHNRERVIALAIREAFDEYISSVQFKTDPTTLAGVIDRTISINRRNLGARNYAGALCAIYFDKSTPEDVWATLQEMSLSGIKAWMEILADRREIQPWVDIDHFADAMAHLQYSTILDWCRGRLNDDEYLPRLAENMLLLIIGSTMGGTSDEARELLISIAGGGALPEFPKAKWVALA